MNDRESNSVRSKCNCSVLPLVHRTKALEIFFFMTSLTLQWKREVLHAHTAASPLLPHHLRGLYTKDTSFSAGTCKSPHVSHLEFPFIPRGRMTSLLGMRCPPIYFSRSQLLYLLNYRSNFGSGNLAWTILS